MSELAVYDNDPTLYLFTSLTAGSSHIVTATSRIETILKANKIPFKGVDTATDDLARKLYGRRAGGRKLPLLVKEGYVIADLEQIEEWNEYDELKDVLGGPSAPAPVITKPSPAIAAAAAVAPAENTPSATPEQNLAIRQLAAEAATLAASKKPTPTNISTTNPLLSEKVNSPAASSPSGILSPRSVPLPTTPNPATPTPKSPLAEEAPTSAIPKLESKPVHSPPSVHADAGNPSDAAAPVSSTTPKSPKIKKGEDVEAVAEVGSDEKDGEETGKEDVEVQGSKEEDNKEEEEKEDTKVEERKEEKKEEENKEEEKKEEEKKEEENKEEEKKEEEKKEEEKKTQEQVAKDTEKAGESVKD